VRACACASRGAGARKLRFRLQREEALTASHAPAPAVLGTVLLFVENWCSSCRKPRIIWCGQYCRLYRMCPSSTRYTRRVLVQLAVGGNESTHTRCLCGIRTQGEVDQRLQGVFACAAILLSGSDLGGYTLGPVPDPPDGIWRSYRAY
jgi:hypothetical protein